MVEDTQDWFLLADVPALGLVMYGPTSYRMVEALRDGASEQLERAGCSVGTAKAESLNDFAELLEAAAASPQQEATASTEPTTAAARLLHLAAKRLDLESSKGVSNSVRVEPAGHNPLSIRPGTYSLGDLARAIGCLGEALEQHSR